MADPFLAITLDSKRRIAQVARALDQPHPGPAAWGLLELLEDVWRRKDPAVSALVLAACFGPDPRWPAALAAFRFLAPALGADSAGWVLHPEEANRLLRPRQSRAGNDSDPVVYFIGFGERGPVKIGYASNVRRRLHCLQTAHVGRLRLLGKIHGPAQTMLALEAELHARFAHLRLRGEWFSDGDDLWAFIKGLS